MSNTKGKLEFYFDCSSPWTYLAFKEIENLQIQSKKVGDFITIADLNAEKSLFETLKYYFPNLD